MFLVVSVNTAVDNPPEPDRVRLFGLVDVSSVDSNWHIFRSTKLSPQF